MIKRLSAALAVVFVAALIVPLGSGSPGHAGPLMAGRVHASYRPGKGKIFVLIIGNDARSGNPDQSRADAIHLAGINVDKMRGGILNFPRDSWVPIPGRGSAKINEALYHGGPELVATTLEQLTGITIDYWVMTGFEGFRNIVMDLGGVRMHIPRDINDPTGSGAHIKAGSRNLRYHSALAYVRTRHSFPNGDIDRSTNQGKFLLALLRKLRRQVSRDPASLLRWMGTTREHTRLDIPADELFRLGLLATELNPKRVGNVTVPVSIGAVGAASVVFISQEAKDLYGRFKKNGWL